MKNLIQQRSLYFWFLLFVFILGMGLRVYSPAHVPPGLWNDESSYAGPALDFMQRHSFPLIYFTHGEAQFGLLPYLLSIGFRLLGDHSYTPRLVMAFLGCLGLLGCWLATCELFFQSRHKEMVALLATSLLAFSYWHLNFSRIIFSASLTPTFGTYSIWLTLYVLRTKRALLAIPAGFATGLGIYTYWQFVFEAPISVLLLLREFIRRPKTIKTIFAIYILTVLLTLAPFVYAFFYYDLTIRLRNVGLNVHANTNTVQYLSSLAHNFWLHIRMLFTHGDQNIRHNYPGQAQLAILPQFGLICAFIASLAYLPFSKKYKARIPILPHFKGYDPLIHPLAICWLWLMFSVMPAALSNEGLPHASRGVCMLIPLHILAAYGLVVFIECLRFIFARHGFPAVFNIFIYTLVGLLLAQQAIAVTQQYFVWMPRHRDARGGFQTFDGNYLRHNFAKEAERIRKEDTSRYQKEVAGEK